jgi:Domain of unknown function (DUF4234)
MSTNPSTGPAGQPRGVAFVILIGVVTLGIYWLYWVYKTQDEMKRHSGDGVGGVLGLVIWIVISPVSAFVIPAEVGNLYANAGRPKPITGWAGLWLFPFGLFLIPAIVWFVKVQRRLNHYWESLPSAPAAPPPSAPAPAS